MQADLVAVWSQPDDPIELLFSVTSDGDVVIAARAFVLAADDYTDIDGRLGERADAAALILRRYLTGLDKWSKPEAFFG